MSTELFGRPDEFPRPAWEILDGARNGMFTGELLFDLDPPVSVYLDRGEVYLAERSTEPPLGDRLIDAGALNAEQLEHGAITIGDHQHLGRLFDRVPSVDRDLVTLMTELMNDECVAWLATRDVHAVIATPYRHHPSGIHRWNRTAAADLEPGDPLPAPPPTAAPVAVEAPPTADPLISWGAAASGAPATGPFEPPTPSPPPVPPTDEPQHHPPPPTSILDADWADRLETHGLPEPDSDPLAAPTPLPPLPTGHPDRFELIWPSGEIDEHFDAGASIEHSPEHDQDRAGPTARVVREAGVGEPGEQADETPELWDFETTGPSFGPLDDRTDTTPTGATPGAAGADRDLTVITDDPVLSMRQAVETIEAEAAGSPALGSTTTDAIRGGDVVLPGRVATRTESSLWNIRGFDDSTNRSVFDETVPAPAAHPGHRVDAVEPAPSTPLTPVPASGPVGDGESGRVSALRRLIGGLRRR